MTTVQQIFDMAIHLMDEQSETNGKTQTTDTTEYKYRTISILNTLLPMICLCAWQGDVRGTPFLVEPDDHKNPNFDQYVMIDDWLAKGVLPYGLAAHLLASENEELSDWFMKRFQLSLVEFREFRPERFEPIATPYGLF